MKPNTNKVNIKKLIKEEFRKRLLFEELSLIIEKELEVGSNLKKKLSSINKPFADKLLQFLSSDKIPDKVTLDGIDFTNDDNKTLTGFFVDGKGNKKNRHFKVGKLLTYMGIPDNEFKGYEIEELISHFKKGTIEDFIVVDGEKILWAYHCENYDEGESMGSCMRYGKAQKYLEMFTNNTEEVECLVLLNPNNNKVRGRALLWHTDDGKTYVDRVYTTNTEYKNLFNLYIEQHGISRTTRSTVTLDNGGEYDYYPYMDTFEYYSPEKNTLTTDRDFDDSIHLQDTGGGFAPGGTYIDLGDREGESVEESEVYYLSYNTPHGYIEGYAHEDDCVYSNDGMYLVEDTEELFNGDIVFKYDDDNFIVELTNGMYEGKFASFDDAVELEPNYYGEGQYITSADDFIHLDSDIYDIPYALDGDTVKAFNEENIMSDDAIGLYPAYYGEGEYGHSDVVTKVKFKGFGYAYVMDDDIDKIEEAGMIEDSYEVEAILEMKESIKKKMVFFKNK